LSRAITDFHKKGSETGKEKQELVQKSGWGSKRLVSLKEGGRANPPKHPILFGHKLVKKSAAPKALTRKKKKTRRGKNRRVSARLSF